ncbi:MAG: alpha-keto acid decarboxylase family protein [Alphaproteobacteria bacterium]
MIAKNPFTVADYLLTRLRQLNVAHVFQVPGDYVKHFTQTLENFEGVTAIGATNELDAGYAADAYARTRGLGAVSVQFGVGSFVALNAIAGAWVERSPVVVISAAPGREDRTVTDMYDVLFHHSTGNLDADRRVYENVTVKAITLSTNIGADQQIDDVLLDAITHQRPVYIACYEEVWGQPCPPPSSVPLTPRERQSLAPILETAVDAAWQAIAEAKRPLILAGVEILRHGLSELLQQIIDASGFLYTTTTLGKTVLDEKGPKFIGTYADVASIDSVREAVRTADCVLALGTIITDDYLDFIESKYADMVLATTSGIRVGYAKYPEVTMRNFLEALLARFQSSLDYPIAATAPPQPRYPEPWASNNDPGFDAEPNLLTYNRFFQHLMKFLTDGGFLEDVVWTFGISSSLYVATNAYGLRKGSFVSSAAWQCIGFETGATSGAQLGSGKRALTVAGDGGFMEVCQCLSTLMRNQLNAVVFVMSNGVYAIEQVFVNIEAFKNGSQHKFDTFDILPRWDYLALAKAFRAEGFRVETVQELEAALACIMEIRDRPALVEVVIPEKDLPGQMRRLGTQP